MIIRPNSRMDSLEYYYCLISAFDDTNMDGVWDANERGYTIDVLARSRHDAARFTKDIQRADQINVSAPRLTFFSSEIFTLCGSITLKVGEQEYSP